MIEGKVNTLQQIDLIYIQLFIGLLVYVYSLAKLYLNFLFASDLSQHFLFLLCTITHKKKYWLTLLNLVQFIFEFSPRIFDGIELMNYTTFSFIVNYPRKHNFFIKLHFFVSVALLKYRLQGNITAHKTVKY